MSARASFRSQLLVGSVLWTFGVMLVVSVLAMLFLAHNPRPHMMVLGWLVAVPAALSVTIGLACMATGAARIRRSLSAVEQLRDQLAQIHRGGSRQVAGAYPAEVQPLVDDLNTLLNEREERIARSAARAEDLAHGLKTPLALLSIDADLVAARGDGDLAMSLSCQVERMRRQIGYHLAQVRVTAGAIPGLCTQVAPSAESLVRTLNRLHAERAITLEHSVPSAHAVRCPREDLEEILGNLLDNAFKWARARASLTTAVLGSDIAVVIDDDGPGLDPTVAAVVLLRGGRADERVPGFGLGLTIARDLSESYGGSLALSRSPLGGLRVSIRLPSAKAQG